MYKLEEILNLNFTEGEIQKNNSPDIKTIPKELFLAIFNLQDDVKIIKSKDEEIAIYII